jgi:hypothetical protein
MKKNNKYSLRPYTHKELVAVYKISWKTLKRSIAPLEPLLGPKIGNYYNIRQVKIIFDNMGVPAGLAEPDA